MSYKIKGGKITSQKILIERWDVETSTRKPSISILYNNNIFNSVASGFDLLEEKLFSKFLKGMAKSYPKLSEKMDFESERTKDDQISFAKANEVFDSIVTFYV